MLKRILRVLRLWYFWVGAIVFAFVVIVGGSFGAGELEKQEGFCASCHTEPESTYQARFVSALSTNRAVDLAAFHHKKLNADNVNIACIDCHGGEGISGRAVVLSLAAWDAVKWFTGTAKQPAQVIFTVQNEACMKCHADAVAKQGFDNHYHNKLLEPGAAYEQCVDCHVSHREGTEANNFQFRNAILPVCQDCHRKENKGPTNMGLEN